MNSLIGQERLIKFHVHKVLEPSVGTLQWKSEPVFLIQDRSGIKAFGKPTTDGFAVLKDSTIAQSVASSLSNHY